MHLLHPRDKNADCGIGDGRQSGEDHAHDHTARVIRIAAGLTWPSLALSDKDDRHKASCHGKQLTFADLSAEKDVSEDAHEEGVRLEYHCVDGNFQMLQRLASKKEG